MGRLAKSRTLSVWMNGQRVGDWHFPASGRQEFLYADSWLASNEARPISLSFPLRPSRDPYRVGVESFFENLLPDSREIRQRIQRRFAIPSSSAFDLLAEVGRDCAGALQLLPEGAAPADYRKITGERLSSQAVARILAASLGPGTRPEAPDEDAFRISLAGAQEKTALLWHDGAWHRAQGTTPTTHIFKLPIGLNPHGLDLSTSVENEWLCAQIVQRYGIPVAPCAMETFGEFKTLVVERFDRRLAPNGAWWLRLPQEDFCQATATPPALKYENEGGPGIRRLMDLLRGSRRSEDDRRDFMRTLFVFWLLAATDGHAKNFSVSLHAGGAYELTPRYDIISAYPIMGYERGRLAPEKITMSMALEGKSRHYRWREIRMRHWMETSKRCGFAGMDAIVGEAIERTPALVQEVSSLLPAGFPAPIADSIFRGLSAAAKRAAGDGAAG